MSDTRDYDEDAAMCECGHDMHSHTGKAWNYGCMRCRCRGFRGETIDAAIARHEAVLAKLRAAVPSSETPGHPK